MNFEYLPPEIQLHIFSYIPYMRSVLSLVSKNWKDIAEDPYIWHLFPFACMCTKRQNSYLHKIDDLLFLVRNGLAEYSLLKKAFCKDVIVHRKSMKHIGLEESVILPPQPINFYSMAAALGCYNIIRYFFENKRPAGADDIVINAAKNAANLPSLKFILSLMDGKRRVTISANDISYLIPANLKYQFLNSVIFDSKFIVKFNKGNAKIYSMYLSKGNAAKFISTCRNELVDFCRGALEAANVPELIYPHIKNILTNIGTAKIHINRDATKLLKSALNNPISTGRFFDILEKILDENNKYDDNFIAKTFIIEDFIMQNVMKFAANTTFFLENKASFSLIFNETFIKKFKRSAGIFKEFLKDLYKGNDDKDADNDNNNDNIVTILTNLSGEYYLWSRELYKMLTAAGINDINNLINLKDTAVSVNMKFHIFEKLFFNNSTHISLFFNNEDELIGAMRQFFETSGWTKEFICDTERITLDKNYIYNSYTAVDRIANNIFYSSYKRAADIFLRSLLSPKDYQLPFVIRFNDCAAYQQWKIAEGAELSHICYYAAAKSKDLKYIELLSQSNIYPSFYYFAPEPKELEIYIFGSWPHSGSSRADEFRLEIILDKDVFKIFSSMGYIPLEPEFEYAFEYNLTYVLEHAKLTSKSVENINNNKRVVSPLAPSYNVTFCNLARNYINRIEHLSSKNYYFNLRDNSIKWVKDNSDFLYKNSGESYSKVFLCNSQVMEDFIDEISKIEF